jgi:hypothetical protein
MAGPHARTVTSKVEINGQIVDEETSKPALLKLHVQ